MSMTYFVYKIINSINNKIYIGKTNDLEKRWIAHIYAAQINKENTYFYNAIRKYEATSFIKEIIEECETEEKALEREIFWIKELNTRHRHIGYNMTDGGDGVSGLKHSEMSKRRMSLIKIGKVVSDETRLKMSNSQKGRIVSQETKEKISMANTGKNNGMFGKSITLKTRKKLSDFQSKRERQLLSEEHKQKNKEAAKKQDRSFRIPKETKLEVVQLYNTGKYTKRQLSEKFRLKYNSIVKIIRTHK